MWRPGLIICGGPWLAVFRPSQRVRPVRLADLIEDAFNVTSLLAPVSP
jgi:hypothetical protein